MEDPLIEIHKTRREQIKKILATRTDAPEITSKDLERYLPNCDDTGLPFLATYGCGKVFDDIFPCESEVRTFIDLFCKVSSSKDSTSGFKELKFYNEGKLVARLQYSAEYHIPESGCDISVS